MPRSLRALDPDSGPVQAFADELRKLWEHAGKPTFLRMSRKTGRSRTAMSEAVGGDHLPTWETVAAFVTACGDNPDNWQKKWERARDARTSANKDSADSNDILTASAHYSSAKQETSAANRKVSLRAGRVISYAATIACTAVIASTVTAQIEGKASENTHHGFTAVRQQSHAAVITVQNKVALGPSELIEDSTPAYLSSKPIPYCRHHGCEVPDSQMSSGVMLVAVCYVHSAIMYNYNLDSSASQENRNRASSTLWYKVILSDGRSGYISEVYTEPADRGGKGLPTCHNP